MGDSGRAEGEDVCAEVSETLGGEAPENPAQGGHGACGNAAKGWQRGRKISFMLPESGLDLRPESGAPVWGRTIRFVLGAGIRRQKTGFGLPAAPLGPPCPASFRSLAMVQFRRLPSAAAEGTTPGQHGRGVAGSTGTQIQNRANPKPLATSTTVI